MLYRTHLLLAFLAGLYGLHIFSFERPLFFFLAVLFFTGAPDLDHPRSVYSRSFFPLRLISLFFRHRGLFHSLFFALFLYALTYSFGWVDVRYGLLVGYTTHLFCDMLTVSGVRLFYPVSDFRLEGFLKTGGIIERVLFWILFIFTLWTIVFFVLG